MALRPRHALWLILALGLGIRAYLALHWFGNGDLYTFEIVAARTIDDPLHAYAKNVGEGAVPYPYPPGYLLWLISAYDLSRAIDEPFHSVAHLVPILADVAIAFAVYVYLGWRGASDWTRVAGFALVMLGTVFMAISGYHGQMDAVAILPGVLALMIWERRPSSHRAIEAGVLLGIGGLLKSVPMVLIVPLVASVRSVREGVKLAGAAGVVFVGGCLPFFLAEPDGYGKVISWAGVPGRGGISVVTDPDFAVDRRMDTLLALAGHPNGFTDWLSGSNGPIAAIALAAVLAFLFRYRPAPIDGIVITWLAVFASSPNFLLQYVVWALPFFIMAGYLWEVAALQLGLVPALIITYIAPTATTQTMAQLYVVNVIALWVFWVVALVVVVRRVIRRRTPAAGASQPPLVELRPAVSSGLTR